MLGNDTSRVLPRDTRFLAETLHRLPSLLLVIILIISKTNISLVSVITVISPGGIINRRWRFSPWSRSGSIILYRNGHTVLLLLFILLLLLVLGFFLLLGFIFPLWNRYTSLLLLLMMLWHASLMLLMHFLSYLRLLSLILLCLLIFDRRWSSDRCRSRSLFSLQSPTLPFLKKLSQILFD